MKEMLEFAAVVAVSLHCIQAACFGDTSTILEFDLNRNNHNSISEIIWYFTPPGGNEVPVARFIQNFVAYPNYVGRVAPVFTNVSLHVNLNLTQLNSNDNGTYRCLIGTGLSYTNLTNFDLKFYSGALPNPLPMNTINTTDGNNVTCSCYPPLISAGDTELYLALKNDTHPVVTSSNFNLSYTFKESDPYGEYLCFVRVKGQDYSCTTLNRIGSGACSWGKATTTTPTGCCQCDPCLAFVIILAIFSAGLLIYTVVCAVVLQKKDEPSKWKIVLIVLAGVVLVLIAITIGLCFGLDGCYKNCKQCDNDVHLFRAAIIFIVFGGVTVIAAVIVIIKQYCAGNQKKHKPQKQNCTVDPGKPEYQNETTQSRVLMVEEPKSHASISHL